MGLKENKDVFFRSLTKKKNNKPADFLQIGKITRVHGLKGEVFVSFLSPPTLTTSQTELAKPKEKGNLCLTGWILQIRKADKIISEKTIVEKFRPHKQGGILQLTEVDSKEKAELLKDGEVFVEKQVFSSKTGENMYLCEVLNFKVYDKKRSYLGKIHAFAHNGAQDLLLVKREKKPQMEIPFVKALVTEVNFESQKVYIDLPEDWPYI